MSVRTVRRTLALLFGIVALVAAGCGGPLELTVAGEPDLNSGGNAAVVRIYQLNGSSNFESAALGRFWQDDRAALADQYIDHRQLLLYPNEAETVPIEVGDETQFIGIAADLREPAENEWREVYPVDELRGRDVRISVGAHGLRVDLD